MGHHSADTALSLAYKTKFKKDEEKSQNSQQRTEVNGFEYLDNAAIT